jgi:hypothetical protein
VRLNGGTRDLSVTHTFARRRARAPDHMPVVFVLSMLFAALAAWVFS